MSEVDNNYVEMEEFICPICGVKHSKDGSILLDTKLKEIKNSVTGYNRCEKCDELFDNGFLALVTISNAEEKGKGTVKIGEANRTGDIIHIKREIFNNIIDNPVDDKIDMIFISEDFKNILTNSIEDGE